MSTTALIAALSALVSLIATGVHVQVAKRYGLGKAIRAEGPQGHLAKSGTPTMGGIAFLLVALVMPLFFVDLRGLDLAFFGLVVAAAALGLGDDLAALQRKRRRAEGLEETTGLLARYRLLVQSFVALAFSAYAVGAGVSWFGPPVLDALAFAFVIVGSINAFNFTDGLDGLAGGIAVIVLLPFFGVAAAASLIGALLGFLWYNTHPARVFMGGVGSEALGAFVAGLFILSGLVWYLPLIALIPVLEVLSVIAQVAYFRATGGKRLLRMSPLHHHFELSGWAETQVVTRFWLATAALTALAVALGARA